MSLDVYLTLEGYVPPQEPVICIREDGQNKQITREEWDRRFPGREPVTSIPLPGDTTVYSGVYSGNITHNLNSMAKEAGIYMHLWRPEEIGIKKAEQLIGPLSAGLVLLAGDPDRFRQFNPKNGWGDYEGLVCFVIQYLNACIKFREATVSVWR